MNDIQEKVFAAFQKEHKIHLTTIRQFLEARKSGKVHSMTEMDDLKRCAHTLKGAARAVGLDFVQEAGVRLEKIFSCVNTDLIKLDDRTCYGIQRVLDGIEAYVADVSTDPSTPSPNDLIRVLDDCLEDITSKTRPISAVKPVPGMGSTAPDPDLKDLPFETDIKRKVFLAFQNEYRIHLEIIRRITDTLTLAPPDQGDINTAFRSAHTLKGAARAVGLPVVQEIAHSIETLFADIRDGRQPAGNDVVNSIVKGLDAIEDYVVSLNRTGEEALPAGSAIHTVEVSHAPEEEMSNTGKTRESENDRNLGGQLKENDTETIRINADRLDQLQRTAEQILSEGLRQQRVARRIKDLKATVSGLTITTGYYSSTLQRTLSKSNNPAVAETVLDYFQNQNQLLPRLAAEIRELGREHTSACRMNANLGLQIQADVLKARMIPAEDVFQFFRKMMRDLAVDEGKQVDFKIRGLEVQADRLVLQRLKDPLMHMLRNAVSHGIERAGIREAAGKNPTGTIHLIIEVDGNRLRITVEDDGNGLDFQRISDLAIQKGYISMQEAEAISQEELLRFICQPGFSTVKMITDLHGRGIGMSVAQEAVNRLRGEITVSSEAKKGTQFVLVIPLTLSTHRLLLVRASGQTFGIPVQNIDRLIRIQFKEILTVEGNPVIIYNGRTVPFGILSNLLALGGTTLIPREHDQILVVLLHSGYRMMGLAVDDILSEEENLIKDLPAPADQISFFAGGFIRADGCVSLIVNPAVLMEAQSQSQGEGTSFSSKEPVLEQKGRSKILIVDDSVTTRTLEKTILESQGYEVHVAVDGIDALDLLENTQIDLVVTDIQMPKMDGFQLIEAMKKSETLKSMPVIIVTSMSDHQDRDRGLNLGADAYIVKQKFDQKNLLETIGQII
ncbi:MAG: response regulator [Pseudomonadota bacterium]